MNLSALKFAIAALAKPRMSREQKLRRLVHAEAQIGGKLFGPTHEKVQREFFFLNKEHDHNVWVWHERIKDHKGSSKVVTTRYEIYPDKVIKAQSNHPHQLVSGAELNNLYQAIQLYPHYIARSIYGVGNPIQTT